MEPQTETHKTLNNKRLIGRYHTGLPGKLMIFTTGMHGNERSGTEALNRVFACLNKNKTQFHGEILGVFGNLEAIQTNKRYLDVDYNRIWTSRNIRRVWHEPIQNLNNREEVQLKDTLELLDQACSGYRTEDICVFDLHNTSSSRGLFTVTFNRKDNILIASSIRIPIIIGLVKALQGTAIEYFNEKGYVSMAFEGGLIGNPRSIDIHEAGIWMLMESTGCIHKSDIPEYDKHQNLLLRASEGFPDLTDLAYVHKIEPEDKFIMKPGYENFQSIVKGEYLADDKYGEIYAPVGGFILMPLYQEQGGEGFFIIRELS